MQLGKDFGGQRCFLTLIQDTCLKKKHEGELWQENNPFELWQTVENLVSENKQAYRITEKRKKAACHASASWWVSALLTISAKLSNDQAVVKIEFDSSNRLFVVLRRKETDLQMRSRKRWKILILKVVASFQRAKLDLLLRLLTLSQISDWSKTCTFTPER